jgi:tetratricopeptide (TPR) repeat protein
MVDKTKIMQEARKLLAKGQVDKAIEEYLKLAKAYPDGNIFNTIGDLYLKKGDNKSAVEEYHNAAKYYTEEGFSLKALAIHKKVLNLNPRDALALIALGELNEEKNIVTDAIKYYLAATDVLSKENRKEELLDVYDRILNLAPNNIKLRIKVSELFSKEGFVPEAAKEYCNIGILFSDRDDMANARIYLTKAIEIQPSNKDVLIALSDLAEKEGNFEEASGHILNAIDMVGEDSELLLKQSHLNVRTGNIEEALTSLNKLLELEPDNYNIRKELGDLYQKTGDIMAAWDEYKQVLDPMIEEGKNLEAMSILETFKEFDTVDNSLKLIELYKAEAEEDKAFNELFELHIAYTEQAKIVEALEVLKQARDIKPEDTEVSQAIGEIERMLNPPEPDREAADNVEASTDETAPEAQDSPEEPAPQEPAPQESAPHAAAAPVEKSASDMLNEADVFIQYGLFSDAKNLLETEKLKNPSSIDIHLKLKKVYQELGEVEQATTECIVLSALYKSSGDEEQSQSMLMEAFALSPHDPRLEGKVDAWTPAPPEPEPEPAAPLDAALHPQNSIDDMFGGNEEELSEADFHMQQGFYSEAADIYRKLSEQTPSDANLKQKLAEAEAKIAEAAAAPPKKVEEVVPFAGESEEELFDFTSILEADEAAEPEVNALDADVQDIFNEFKKGLSQEVEAEDSATHYDLGIAYKEMGLVDDAIKEFQTSQRDPSYYSQSMTMIGLCCMSKGTYALAVDAFTAALMKMPASDENRWSLKYDLGEAYEFDGNTTEALQMYRDVIKKDPNFRDVQKKMLALGGSAPASEPAAATEPSSESQGAPQAKPQPKSGPDEKPKSKKSRVSYI